MSGSIIKKCGCRVETSHACEFQNKKYGEGVRVMNLNQKKNEASCTVCGKNHKI